MDDVAVRPPALTELRDAREVLVEALAADPSWSHVLPDGRGRRAALRALVGVALADSGRHARVAVAGGRVLAQPCGSRRGAIR